MELSAVEKRAGDSDFEEAVFSLGQCFAEGLAVEINLDIELAVGIFIDLEGLGFNAGRVGYGWRIDVDIFGIDFFGESDVGL